MNTQELDITINQGLTFFSRPKYQNTVLRPFNNELYLIEQKDILTGETRSNILLSLDDIQNDLNNQEEYKIIIEQSIQFELKMKQQEAKQKQSEEEEQKEYNFVYGYCDNKNSLQSAKILKVLNKEIKYNGQWIKRKDFIKQLIDNGWTLYIIDSLLTSSRKIQGERIENYKYNVPAIRNGSELMEITKTEYDYAYYLMNL